MRQIHSCSHSKEIKMGLLSFKGVSGFFFSAANMASFYPMVILVVVVGERGGLWGCKSKSTVGVFALFYSEHGPLPWTNQACFNNPCNGRTLSGVVLLLYLWPVRVLCLALVIG